MLVFQVSKRYDIFSFIVIEDSVIIYSSSDLFDSHASFSSSSISGKLATVTVLGEGGRCTVVFVV